MFESLDDPVDVLTAFEEGAMRPLRFRWQGRVVRVQKITGQWNRREGQAVLRYFAVQGGICATLRCSPPAPWDSASCSR